MADSDVMFLFFDDVFSINQTMSAGNQWDYAAWFSDFTYAEFSVVREPQYCHTPEPGSGYPFDLVCSPPDMTFTSIDNLPGDTQGDGVVDLQDMNNVRNFFGEPASDTVWFSDANGDGMVDLGDLNDARNNFGADYRQGSNPIPEPTTTALLLVGMTAMILLRSWR